MQHIDANDYGVSIRGLQRGDYISYRIIVQDNDGHTSYYTNSFRAGDTLPTLYQNLLTGIAGIAAIAIIIGIIVLRMRTKSALPIAPTPTEFPPSDEEGILPLEDQPKPPGRYCEACSSELPPGAKPAQSVVL